MDKEIGWMTTVFTVAANLTRLLGTPITVSGPRGLRAEMRLCLTRGKDKTYAVVSPAFDENGQLFLAYDTGEKENRYSPGSLGALNGCNNVQKPLPEDIREIAMALFPEFAKKQIKKEDKINDLKNMSISELDAYTTEQCSIVWTAMQEYAAQNPLLKEGTILDENQSVRWNREEVDARNKQRAARIRAFERKSGDIFKAANEEIKRRITEEYGLSKAAASLIFTEAYERGHSEGLRQVWCKADDLARIVKAILNAEANPAGPCA